MQHFLYALSNGSSTLLRLPRRMSARDHPPSNYPKSELQTEVYSSGLMTLPPSQKQDMRISYSRRVPEVPPFLWFKTFSILIVQCSPFVSKPDLPVNTIPHPGFLSTCFDRYMGKLKEERQYYCDQRMKKKQLHTVSPEKWVRDRLLRACCRTQMCMECYGQWQNGLKICFCLFRQRVQRRRSVWEGWRCYSGCRKCIGMFWEWAKSPQSINDMQDFYKSQIKEFMLCRYAQTRLTISWNQRIWGVMGVGNRSKLCKIENACWKGRAYWKGEGVWFGVAGRINQFCWEYYRLDNSIIVKCYKLQ